MNFLLILGICGMFMLFIWWFASGAMSNRKREMDKTLDAYTEIMRENHKADTSDDVDKRVREKYGRR